MPLVSLDETWGYQKNFLVLKTLHSISQPEQYPTKISSKNKGGSVMEKKRTTAFGLVAMFSAFALSGCGGGGSSTTPTPAVGGGSEVVTGLAVASKVSVVDAKSSSGSAKLTALKILLSVPLSSDYNKDQPVTYVQDRTTEAFSTVNQILCSMAQTKYDLMVNKGAYKAQINSKSCGGNDSTANANAGQQGDSSSTNAPDYDTWTIDSTRADNSSDHIVKVWIHEKARSGNQDPEKVIQAKVTITEAASAANPYGLFAMNFAGYTASNGVVTSTTPMFKGTLKAEKDSAGKVTLKFIEQEKNSGGKSVAMQKNTDGSGNGSASMTDNYSGTPQTLNINFAYNTDLFHRKNVDNTEDICLDRTNFEVSAWRYGMYDDTAGSRVDLANPGFPINSAANGSGTNGWASFYGLSLPPGSNIANGSTVYRMNYGQSASATPYTVMLVGGKLKKHTQNFTTLGAIKNIPLEGYMENNTMYRVIWDAAQGKLMKIASAPQSNGGSPAWSDITPVAIDTTNMMNGGDLNFWSQSLGGQVHVKLANCSYVPGTMGSPGHNSCDAPGVGTQVVFYAEDIVYPEVFSSTKTFACFDNCPQAFADGMHYDTNGMPITYPQDFSPTATGKNYSFGTDMILKDGANPVVLTSSSQSNNWGFNSGALFDPAAIDATTGKTYQELLACPWNSQQTCGWQAWSVLPVFYTWETGPSSWNQLTALKDANNVIVKFDPPMRVEYVHSQTDSTKPDYKYNNVKFYLDYQGFGQLNGIPGKCFDMTNGQTVTDCSGPTTRWVPEFTIPAGSSASYSVNNTSHSTLIKPLELEQRMLKTTLGRCSTLPLSTLTLPTVSEWTDPALGTEPAVTGAPAVIGGVVQ